MSVANGPKLTFAEFEKIFNETKNWSEFSAENLEKGSLNYITSEVVIQAAKQVQTGRIVRMSLSWNTASAIDNPSPALHYMTEIGDKETPEPTCNKDFIGVDFHGKAVSHFDAFTHIAFKDTLYGGKISSQVVHSYGSDWGTVDKLGAIVTRGVLLDAARLKGLDWIEPGTAIMAQDILDAEAKFGFKISKGDAVLLRSGHFNKREKDGFWDPHNLSAGFHVEVMQLLKERKVSVIGADGDSDVRPSPVEGVGSPIHVLALPALGIPLLDNLHLEKLGLACEQENRWTFQFVLAPLNIPGGTGSPVDPIAVF